MTELTWIGKTLGGRYLIEAELGHGGMSTVYKATDSNLRRVVAVKLIHPHLSDNPDFVRRFEAEATAVAQMRHPNIIQVYDFNHKDKPYYIVFEFVPGETLQDQLQRIKEAGRQMEKNTQLKIATSIGNALQYAHTQDIIHRDVKPANVMLNVQGEAILADFGIVKMVGGTQHTATGAVLGTARYMSPEQIKGERVDARSDIYSYGAMLYEMVGGRPPFDANSAMTLMMMHINEPVPDVRQIRSDVLPELAAVINKALDKEPDQRYQTMTELLSDLNNIQGKGSMNAPAASTAAGATMQDSDLTKVFQPESVTIDSGSNRSQEHAPASPTPSTVFSEKPKHNKTMFWGIGALFIVAVIVVAFIILRPSPSENVGDGGSLQNPAVVDLNATETNVAMLAELTSSTETPTTTEITPSLETTVTADEPKENANVTVTATANETATALAEVTPTHTPDPSIMPTDPVKGSSWTRPTDDMVMVYVPEGSFFMGSNPEVDLDALEMELPQHEVMLDGFWMDQQEVSNAQFTLFVADTNYVTTAEIEGVGKILTGTTWEDIEGADWQHPSGLEGDLEGLADHPVVLVSWLDAEAYCTWAGAHLPTEAQWEYVARGEDSYIYPWGNDFDGTLTNICDTNCPVTSRKDETYDDGYTLTAPVGSYPDGVSWIGIFDMTGNVWEWTADYYADDYYTNSPIQNPRGPEDGTFKVLRGGGWNISSANARSARRAFGGLTGRNDRVGFRCAFSDLSSLPTATLAP